MIEALESRQLFSVAPVGGVTPVAEPEAAIVSDATDRSSTAVVCNDLAPDNVQRKHVSNVRWTGAR